jgi:hypothetical protein
MPPKKDSKHIEAKAAPQITTDKLLRALVASLSQATEPELVSRLKAAAERLAAARKAAP